MWQCEVSVEIEVPPEDVYRRLKDFSRHSEFSDGLAKVEQITPGPVGAGTRFRSEETVPGKYTSFCEITELAEPSLIAWRAWVNHVMKTEWEFRIAAAGTGTRLVQVSRWWATGPAGLLMLNLHRKRHVPRENQASLDRIKAVLEAQEVAA